MVSEVEQVRLLLGALCSELDLESVLVVAVAALLVVVVVLLVVVASIFSFAKLIYEKVNKQIKPKDNKLMLI